MTDGFSEIADTTEATTNATDASMMAYACGSFPTDASVWYSFQAPADGTLTIDTWPPTYLAGIIVLTHRGGTSPAASSENDH